MIILKPDRPAVFFVKAIRVVYGDPLSATPGAGGIVAKLRPGRAQLRGCIDSLVGALVQVCSGNSWNGGGCSGGGDNEKVGELHDGVEELESRF